MPKKQHSIAKFLKSISPGAWPFIIALFFIILGLAVPPLWFLFKLGLFVFVVYLVIWIVWFISEFNS